MIDDDFDNNNDDNIDAQIKELQAKKEREKSGKKTKEEIVRAYKAFESAKKIYDETKINLHRGHQPRYFYSLHTSKKDKRGNQINVQDLVYFTHGSLYPSFVELESDQSKRYLRKMIEGETIRMQRPTGEIEQHIFDRRVYDKLTNTNHMVDDKTYNLVNLDNRLIPQITDRAVCPTIFKALLYSITGNVITWNDDTKQWDCDKQDTLEWFEKWVYGAVHANIGDNSMSMPVIFGAGKVGKNALFDIVFRQMLGTHACFSSTWDVVDSNFNSFKLGKVFMFIDEIPAREDWDKVKNMTGSPVTYVKEKYGPEFEVDNCIVNTFGSNQTTYPLPWEDGNQMMRVSPIKTNPKSTFAENTVRMLNKEHEGELAEPFVDALIRASGNDPETMTEFKKGDFILRNLLAAEWQSRDSAQQALNYLHAKYQTDYYQLSPLRSKDWEDIKDSKVNGIDITVSFIRAHDPELVTTTELHEIYFTAMADTGRAKNKQNFIADIKEHLQNSGYEFKRTAILSGGIREDIFVKTSAVRGTVANYIAQYDRYIKTEVINGRQIKHLIWPDVIEPKLGDDLFDNTRWVNIMDRIKK